MTFGSFLRSVGDTIVDKTEQYYDDAKQLVDNCGNMDNRPTPNKTNPTEDKNLIQYINPCTMYKLDENLQPDVSNLLFPNDPENVLYGDTFTIPSYCAPNVAIFNMNFSTGYQASFIDTYCKNITPGISGNSNLSPQDIVTSAYDTTAQPEWLSNTEANLINTTLNKVNITNQIFDLTNEQIIVNNYSANQLTSTVDSFNNTNNSTYSTTAQQDVANATNTTLQNANQEVANSAASLTLDSLLTVGAVGTAEAVGATTLAVALAPLAVGAAIGGFITDIIKDDDCYYNDFKVPTKVGGYGCCRGQCAIRGKSGQCKRNIFGYKADVFRCCLQDYYCYVNNGNNLTDDDSNNDNNQALYRCYQNNTDPLKKHACDPHYRGMTQPYCKNILYAYCTGQVPFAGDQSSLLQAWVQSADPIELGDDPNTNFKISAPCLNFLARLLSETPGVCTWDDFTKTVPNIVKTDVISSNFLLAQNLMNSLLDNYLKTYGNPVIAVNSDGYFESSAFINWYFSFCQQYPILCQDALRNNFCVNYTLQDLANNPDLANWCGCYLPNSQYEQYTQYNVDINCTPTCNRANTIPLVNDITGHSEVCSQNVCIMDNIAVDLINTESNGNVSFTQACHSCGQNSVANVIDENSTGLSAYTNNDTYTSFNLQALTQYQINNQISNYSVQYPRDETSNPNVGYAVLASFQVYPPSSSVPILCIANGLTASATFSIGSQPSGGGTQYFLTGLTNKPSNLFDSNGNSIVASGSIVIITTPLPTGKYIYFQVIGVNPNNNGGVNISSSQTIGNYVSQFNLGRNTNTCQCIFHNTTISFVESKLQGANFAQNCGDTTTNLNGATVPNSIDLSNNISISNQISSSITSTQDFIEEVNLNKTEFIIGCLAVSSFILVLMQYFLTKYPLKYVRIIFTFLIFIGLGILAVYLYYSYTVNWGIAENWYDTVKAAI